MLNIDDEQSTCDCVLQIAFGTCHRRTGFIYGASLTECDFFFIYVCAQLSVLHQQRV